MALGLGCVIDGPGRGTAHRLHRADHRPVRPDRQGHGERLPALSRRAWRQARRHGRQVRRRRQPGQARRRRHQSQETHPARQGADVHRRPARLDRLCAGAGEHRRKDAVHFLGLLGRRSDAAPSQQISVLPAHQLVEFAAASRPRTMGLRSGLQESRHDRGRLRLRLRDGRRIPEGIRGLRRQGDPENLAAARHQGLRAIHPEHQGGRRCHLHDHGRPDGAAIPQAAARGRQQEADRRPAASATTNSCCLSWATK